MDEYTYDDDGIPTLRDDTSVSSKASKPETVVNYSGIFQIDHKSYDVELFDDRIRWKSMTGSKIIKDPQKKKGRGLLKRMLSGSKSMHFAADAATLTDTGDMCIYMKDIYAVRLKKSKVAGSKSGSDGVCIGVEINTYERKEGNKLRENVVLLGHPSADICTRWTDRIQEILKEISRPRKLKVFLQAYAGKKNARHHYNAKVSPLFETAGVESSMTMIQHNEHIKQEMAHLDLSEFDCLVCMGGDGTASNLINHLLNKTQQAFGADPRPGFTPRRPNLPVGIIPVGSINQIATSVMGTDDVVTATLHIILGHFQSADVCSVWKEDRLVHWGFNCHYGYCGNVLTYRSRFTQFGEKAFELSFMKALTNSKLRPYEVDIQYMLSPDAANSNPMDGKVCTKSCSVCKPNQDKFEDPDGAYTDMVEVLDPLDMSNNSSLMIDLSNENPWKNQKGEYLGLSIMSLPGRNHLAPAGTSKYGHLNDGCLDLVLVQATSRKEFVRYLRRHGNDKNQFDLPFVTTARCTEIKFRQRLEQTWKHKDWQFSEIDYEMKKVSTSGVDKRTKSVEVICDIEDEDDDDDLDLEDDLDDDIDDGKIRPTNHSASSSSARGSESSHSRANSMADVTSAGGVKYRPTWQEQERERRRKSQRKKEEKKKAKAEIKSKSVWNMDNEVQTHFQLHFRAHQGLITLCGEGIADTYEPEETAMSCLTVMRK